MKSIKFCKSIFRFDTLLFILLFTIPYVTIMSFSNFVIQVETLIFLAILINYIYILVRGKLFLVNKFYLSEVTFYFLLVIIILAFVGIFNTFGYLLSHLQEISYWFISFLPLILHRRLRKYNIVDSILFSSVLGSILVIVMKVLSNDSYFRSQGFINHSNLAGALFTVGGVIALVYFLSSKKPIFLFVTLVNLFAIFATGSRESLLGFLISVILLIFLSIFQNPRKSLFSVFIIAVTVLLSYYILNFFFSDMFERYTNTIFMLMSNNPTDINLAFSGRPVIWRQVFEYVKINPQRPLGFAGLRTVINAAYAHNMFLQSWIIGGVIGLIVFSGYLLYVGYILFNNYVIFNNELELSLLLIFVSYCITGLVSDHFLNYYSWNFIFFSLLSYSLISSNKNISLRRVVI